MRRALLLVAAFLVLLAITVPAALIYYIGFTEDGLQFVLNRVPHRIGDVRLEIVAPRGTLAHGIEVERVEIDERLAHLRIENIRTRLTLIPLLWQTIRSPDTSVGSVLIQVKRHTKPPRPAEPQFLPRWLIISLEHARVGRVVVSAPNGVRLEYSAIAGSAVIRHKTIRLFEAQFQWGDAQVSGIGELRAGDPLKLDIDSRIHWTPPGQPLWTASSTAKGNLNALEIVGHTVAPFRSDLTGRALDLTSSRWHWVGHANVHDFDLRAWGIAGPLGLITGQLEMHGDSSGFGARGPLNPTGLHVGLFDAQFEGAYSNHVLTARNMRLEHIGSGAQATGAGTFEIVPHGPRVNLHGSWRDFRWPLIGTNVPVRCPSGDFTLQGILPYTVRAKGIARVRDLPSMPVEVEGTLGKDRFVFSQAEVDLYGGHASVNGGVIWSPEQSWSIAGRLTGIEPNEFRPDLPGKLNFTLAVQGRGFDPKSDVTIEFHDVSGRLREAAASGDGKLSHSGTTWQFERLRLSLGRTNLSLDGRLGEEQVDLRFSVAAEDLSLLAADSRGQLKASGTLRGTVQDPTVTATAHGSGIHHDGFSLEGFDAEIDFDPLAQHDSRIDVRLRKLTYRDRTLQGLTFTLGGPATRYSAHVDAQADGLAATASASGAFVHGVFEGHLETLTMNGTQPLHLELEKPVGLQVSRTAARLEWLCLVGTPSNICADGDWTPKQWSTTLTANRLPINTLTAGMTPAVEYQGTMNVLARLFGNEHAAVQGSLRIEIADAALSHRLLSHRIERTTLGSGTVTVSATPVAINAEAELTAGEIGTMRAKLTAERGAARWQDMTLLGELHAQTSEVSLISLYVPDIDRAAGRLAADVEVSGTLGAPLTRGAVRLADAEMDLYQVNLRLRQVGVEAHLTDQGLNFTGAARIGSGAMTAGGHLEWRESLPYGQFSLQGTDLRVVDIPEAQIDASPDFRFDVQGRKIEATGTVMVPNARIVPKDLTGAVRSSSDEVIVGAEADDPAKRFEVVSAITLTLGDHVSIETYGLKGRLTGSITARSGYDAITRGAGELSVEEGKYTAYAHNLDIERGRLIFTGGPLDNPGIDIRAIRKFPDVTAGVNVRGTLQQPRMSFFSNPSLPQAEIVSLILSGSREATQNRQTGVASNEALVQGGAILAQQLGSRIGIEDIGVESDLLTNDTSFVLGKYLSPRLYVSYGVSLTQTLNVLKLRYSLGDHWTIKTEMGQARGADLVFSVDK